MKNPLQSLLIGLAICLCGLCTWQWYSQVLLRNDLTRLAQTAYDQSVAIRGYTNSIATMEQQIATLDASLTELRDLAKSNTATLARLRQESSSFSNAAVRYKDLAEENTKQANDVIHRQQDTIQRLISERDAFVKQLNESIQDRNGIVTQYNALVKRVQEMQSGQTNPPPGKK